MLKRAKQLTLACLVLALLCVGLGAWAVVGQVRIGRLNARVAALEAANEAEPASAQVVVSNPDAVAAEFSGGVVTAAEAAQAYAEMSAYYQSFGMEEAEYAQEVKTAVLDGLIENKILEAKAKEYGVFETGDAERAEIEAQAKQEYEDTLRYYMDFRFDDSKTEEQVREETIAYLAQTGYTQESAIENAMRSAWQKRLFEKVVEDSQVTDEEMRAFYESRVASAEMTYSVDYDSYELDAEAGRAMVWNPEGVRRVDAILVPFDEDQGVEYLILQGSLESGDASAQAQLDALYASLEPKAQGVLDRLNAGEDFEALMREFGTLAPNGCYISDRSTVCGAEVRDAAMALEHVGSVSGLVRSDGGICILRYAADVPAGQVPYEEAADQLRDTFEEEMKTSRYNATVVQWIADANAQYHTDVF